jgi:hypothetical protein
MDFSLSMENLTQMVSGMVKISDSSGVVMVTSKKGVVSCFLQE